MFTIALLKMFKGDDVVFGVIQFDRLPWRKTFFLLAFGRHDGRSRDGVGTSGRFQIAAGRATMTPTLASVAGWRAPPLMTNHNPAILRGQTCPHS